MSVADADAREHMAADIAQLDAIIDKFLDYARPEPPRLEPVSLNAVVDAAVYAVADYEDMRVTVNIPENMDILADQVELSRVLSNLLENARRYGKTPETGIARVEIAAKTRDQWVLIKVRDHGAGVAPETLSKLTGPFSGVTQPARRPPVPAWAWRLLKKPFNAWAVCSVWPMRDRAGWPRTSGCAEVRTVARPEGASWVAPSPWIRDKLQPWRNDYGRYQLSIQ